MQESQDTEFAIQTFYDFLEVTKICTYEQFITIMKNQLADFCSENGYCQNCIRNGNVSETHFDTHLEEREFQGAIVYEPCGAIVCEECGNIE